VGKSKLQRERRRPDGSRLPTCACLACGHKLDAATLLDDDGKRPEEGDFAVCIQCSHLMAYDAAGGVRERICLR
jgi:transcription elongation factor Elf1